MASNVLRPSGCKALCAGRLFACRHCYRLGYAIQRDGGPMDRAHHRLHRKLRYQPAAWPAPRGNLWPTRGSSKSPGREGFRPRWPLTHLHPTRRSEPPGGVEAAARAPERCPESSLASSASRLRHVSYITIHISSHARARYYWVPNHHVVATLRFHRLRLLVGRHLPALENRIGRARWRRKLQFRFQVVDRSEPYVSWSTTWTNGPLGSQVCS